MRVSSADLRMRFDEEDGGQVRLMWGFAINATSENAGESCVLKCVDLFTTAPGEIRSYVDLFGREGQWDDLGTDDDDSRAILSMLGHTDVTDVSWCFQRAPCGSILLIFRGLTWIVRPPEFQGDVSVDVSIPLSWSRVACGRRDEKECAGLLKTVGLEDSMSFSRDSKGVSALIPSGYPRRL